MKIQIAGGTYTKWQPSFVSAITVPPFLLTIIELVLRSANTELLVILHPQSEFSWKVRVIRSNPGNLLKSFLL